MNPLAPRQIQCHYLSGLIKYPAVFEITCAKSVIFAMRVDVNPATRYQSSSFPWTFGSKYIFKTNF